MRSCHSLPQDRSSVTNVGRTGQYSNLNRSDSTIFRNTVQLILAYCRRVRAGKRVWRTTLDVGRDDDELSLRVAVACGCQGWGLQVTGSFFTS